MEELPVSPETEDVPPSRKSRRRSAGDFLQSYLLRRKNLNSGEKSNDDDDDEESVESGGSLAARFRRSLRRLRNFGGLVVTEPLLRTERKSEAPAYAGGPEENRQSAPSEAAGHEIGGQFQQHTTDSQGANLEGGASSRLPPAEADHSGPPHLAAEGAAENDTIRDPEHMYEAPLQREAGVAATDPQYTLERVVYERNAMDKTAEVVVDPQARVLAGTSLVATGLESIGRRKADGKIRRQVDKLAGAIQQERNRTERLEQAVASNRPDAQRLDLWQQAFERSPAASRAQEQPEPVKQIEKLQPSDSVSLFEKAKPARPDKPPESERLLQRTDPAERKTPPTDPEVEKLLHPQETKVRPETVREEVEKAAVNNLPLERLYERRHEVKDDAAAAQAAAARASSLAAAAFKPVVPAPVPTGSTSIDDIPKAPAPIMNDARLYKNAVLNGLWGAVVVLLIIAASGAIR